MGIAPSLDGLDIVSTSRSGGDGNMGEEVSPEELVDEVGSCDSTTEQALADCLAGRSILEKALMRKLAQYEVVEKPREDHAASSRGPITKLFGKSRRH